MILERRTFFTMKQNLSIYETDLYPLVWLLETTELVFFIKNDFDILLLFYFI